MNNLDRKTALITGASKRLGKATALTLAENGINTIIHYNNSEREALETVEQSKSLGVISAKIQYDFNKLNGIKTG